MSKKDTLAILLPYAFKRRSLLIPTKWCWCSKVPLWLNHYADGSDGIQPVVVRTHLRVMVFGAAGIIYLVVNGLLTL